MKSRLLVAAAGIPVLLWVILWAPLIVLEFTIALLSAIGAYELMKCVGAQESWRVGTAAAIFLTMILSEMVGSQCFIPMVMGCIIGIFAIAVLKAGVIRWKEISTAIFALVVIPYAFASFLRLEDMGYHRAFLLLPLIFSFSSDTGAYFAGRALGRHKLAPKVSPNKTVEGSIGGLLGNAVGGGIFAGVMNVYFEQSIDLIGIVILGIFCSVIAQLGDLSFSLIKREFGIKDYGNLFLAHGGVLDRFDSVLFVAPVLALIMPWLL